MALGCDQEAAACLERSLQIRPDKLQALLDRASALDMIGLDDEALLCANEALKIDAACASAWFRIGVIRHGRECFDEAIADYDRALKRSPEDTTALGNKAMALRSLGRLKEALSVITNPVRINDQQMPNLACKVGLLIDLERHQEALEAVDPALKHGAAGVWWRIIQGDAYYDLARYAEADIAYDQALDIEPENAEALADKGWVARQQGRDEDALRYFEHVLVITPTNVQAAQQRAAALYRLDRYSEALAAYERLLELDPNDSHLWYFKGVSLYELGHPNAAVFAFKLATQLDPDDVDTWHWLGFTLKKLNRPDEAAEAYQHALALDANNGKAWNEQVEILLDLRRFQDALGSTERAITLKGPSVNLLIIKGRALQGLERYLEALEAFREAVSKEPSASTHWYQSGAESALGHNDEALANIDEAIALQPKYAAAYIRRARYLRELGRRDEAIAAAAKATAVEPNNGITWGERAGLLWRFGRYEEADSAIDTATCLRPEDPDIKRWQTFIHEQITRPFEDKTLKLRDGRILGYCDYGDPNGMPPVYCHGLPGSRLDQFLAPEELVARHIRLIVPDRPGFGLSTFKKAYLLDWADDLIELIDALELNRFTVVGASGGGGYAMACAAKFPDRVAKLGLICSVAPYGNPGTDINEVYLGRWRRRVLRLLPWQVHRLLGAVPAAIVTAQPRIAYLRFKYVPDFAGIETNLPLTPRQIEAVKADYAQHCIGSSWETRIFNKPWDFKPEDSQSPTWLWHGEKDSLAPISGARYLASAIHNCHAKFYPDDTHDLFTYLPEIVTTLFDSSSSD